MKIFKYRLPSSSGGIVELPLWAEVVSAGYQEDKLYIWAKVNQDEKAVVRRNFHVAHTGCEIHQTTISGRCWHIRRMLMNFWIEEFVLEIVTEIIASD